MIQLDGIREQFLANLSSLDRRTAVTQAQLTSGFRISQPADDPTAVGDVLQLEFDINRVNQVVTNLNNIKSQANSADSALQSANSLLDQLRSIGAQGANGTQGSDARTVLSQQVGQVLDQLVNISRSTYQGVYVFSGDQGLSPAYQTDFSSPTGVDRLLTAPATKLAQDTTGLTFSVSRSAQDIFDHRNPDDSVAGDNVFAAVNNLRLALANNDQAGITDALTTLQTAQTYLSQQDAFYGSVQSRVINSLAAAQKLQIQWQTALGQERDTDIATATTDLASENLNRQAAVQAEAAMPRTSLFDYLQSAPLG